MVQIIGAGLPRTGTSSMKAALEQLGYGPCYHMFELLSHPGHLSRWQHALEAEPVDWDSVVRGYRAGVDWPFSHFWRELAAAYPRAKVVLTDRDPRRWYASMSATIFRMAEGMLAGTSAGPREAELFEILHPIWSSLFGEAAGVPGREQALAAFERHRAEVVEAVPAERLLVYRLGQGWGPLCGFLGADEPSTPFPHLNETEVMHRVMGEVRAGGDVAPPFG
ncbi:sulfotransferase family protein [Streptomonospora halophila]|uniref:Sulfotransferase family protein n=1 Tax=Streptomonospora halophila TaxID=427369 RepID=A0ABP9GC14_9ACTN